METLKIFQYLKPNLILSDLQAQDKNGVLTELANRITDQAPGLDAREILRVLLDRERLGSTGIGEGFAIPHGKIKSIDRMIIAFGRSRQGIPFDSMDGKRAFYFFVLIAPEDSAALHLKALAKISRFIKNSSFKESLSRAPNCEELERIIQEQDEMA